MNFFEKISLYFRDKDFRIGELLIDAYLTETHELRADVTERPTESGKSFVDHIYNLPLRLELTGIISNTPMTLVGLTAFRTFKNFVDDFRQFDGGSKAESNDLALLAYKKLEELFSNRQPITISTSLKDYPNMVLENLTVERGKEFVDVLKFCCSAVQIRIVKQKHIAIPKVKSVLPKENLGKQEAKPPDKSLLHSFKEYERYGNQTMNILEIPIPHKCHFKEEVELFGKIFILEFELLESVGYRVLHIYDAQEKPLALGLRLINNWPMFQYESISFVFIDNQLMAYAHEIV